MNLWCSQQPWKEKIMVNTGEMPGVNCLRWKRSQNTAPTAPVVVGAHSPRGPQGDALTFMLKM
ncbi:hypothetical protein BgiMline_009685, partial [Biomphalaria glabrata]